MFVTFLSDYGDRDEFAGVCRGVLARLAPAARVIDITHGIPPQDVRHGALALRNALPYLPAGVHLAVVDPQVGGARRAVALACAQEGRTLVGPDNGLLMPAAERFGGVVEAVDIARSPWRIEPVSATFHGRDVFAPVAAALARGEPLAAVGEPCATEDLEPLALPTAQRRTDGLAAHVLLTDHFGNAILDATHDDLTAIGLEAGAPVAVIIDGRTRHGRFVSTFADVGEGELLLYEDAQRQLALAVNRGSARHELRLCRDAELVLRTC